MTLWERIAKYGVFVGSGEIKQAVQNVYEAYSAFDNDILGQKNVLTLAEQEQYGVTHSALISWMTGLGFWELGSVSTLTTADDFAGKLRYWRDLFNSRATKKAIGPGTDLFLPRSPASTPSEDIKYLVGVVSLTVGMTAIAKILRG